MIRKIIHINEEKCNGCGACANACHEGAIQMVDGKARLMRDDFCDGLGDCLPACPVDAIHFVEREAAAYDEKAVEEHKKSKEAAKSPCGCPGSQARAIRREADADRSAELQAAGEIRSELTQWPVQIKLAPVRAPYFDGAKLLIAADCSAYAYGDFHRRYINGRVTLIGCPKLADADYAEKLGGIIRANDIRSITVARMEVPCCGGIENAVNRAVAASGKYIPVKVDIITTDGQVID